MRTKFKRFLWVLLSTFTIFNTAYARYSYRELYEGESSLYEFMIMASLGALVELKSKAIFPLIAGWGSWFVLSNIFSGYWLIIAFFISLFIGTELMTKAEKK